MLVIGTRLRRWVGDPGKFDALAVRYFNQHQVDARLIDASEFTGGLLTQANCGNMRGTGGCAYRFLYDRAVVLQKPKSQITAQIEREFAGIDHMCVFDGAGHSQHGTPLSCGLQNQFLLFIILRLRQILPNLPKLFERGRGPRV